MKNNDAQSQTTAFDVIAWLYEQGRYGPDACSQERDWCEKMNSAALEIERLREVVWLYVDPATVKPSYAPVVERCKQS